MPDPCYHLSMKHWCLTFCLVIASLFGSINPALSETRKFSSDLPTCQGSPIKRDDDYIRLKWTNCYGVVKYPFMMAALRFPTKEGGKRTTEKNSVYLTPNAMISIIDTRQTICRQ